MGGKNILTISLMLLLLSYGCNSGDGKKRVTKNSYCRNCN